VKKKAKSVDTKIDELTKVVVGGFSDLRKEMRGVRTELGEVRDELKGDIANLHNEMKEDMTGLRDEFKADMKFLRGDIDIMLDRHIGTFRKDYDDLAMRVKKLEQLVLTR